MSSKPTHHTDVIAAKLDQLEHGHHLSRIEAEAVMQELLSGRMAHADVVRMLLAMRAKSETIEELVGFALVMRRQATPIRLNPATGAVLDEWPLVDTCGTGGDSGGTFNVSTAAAFVVAGAGVRVAKHGNR